MANLLIFVASGNVDIVFLNIFVIFVYLYNWKGILFLPYQMNVNYTQDLLIILYQIYISFNTVFATTINSFVRLLHMCGVNQYLLLERCQFFFCYCDRKVKLCKEISDPEIAIKMEIYTQQLVSKLFDLLDTKSDAVFLLGIKTYKSLSGF